MVNLNNLGQTKVPDRTEAALNDCLQQYNAAYERIARRLVDVAGILKQVEPRFFEDRMSGLELRVVEGQGAQPAYQAVMEAPLPNLFHYEYKDHPKLDIQIPKVLLYQLIRDLSNLKGQLDPTFTRGQRHFDFFSPAPLVQLECSVEGVKDGGLREIILYGANVTKNDKEGRVGNAFYIDDDLGFGKSLSIELPIDFDALTDPNSKVYQVNKGLAALDLSKSGKVVPIGVLRLVIMERIVQQIAQEIYQRDASSRDRIAQLGLLSVKPESKPIS